MLNALLGFGPFLVVSYNQETWFCLTATEWLFAAQESFKLTIITMRRINGGLCVAAVREDSDVIKSNIPTCIHPPLIHEHKLRKN